MTTIRFDRVSVEAATHEGVLRILTDVDLTLTEHRVALIGANGSGKSTLARLVNGLTEPSQGSVLVDDVDVARHGRHVRRRVAFAFSEPAAQLVMPTVIEDVALSLRRQISDRDERDVATLQVLTRFGLAELAYRSVHALSGGQKQLTALAGVLATDPDILVADEPTTLLDLRNARLVADRLFGLRQQLVLVTHDLEMAERCDRVVMLEGGRVVADGPASDVVAQYRQSAVT